ncbi:MAG: NADH-quinone oxidoreductase subunit NuoH [Acidobacteria bacterium]|nr:NADH-quinone oxidoreductase subunit NuoH [Acidobacteriota bacterium]
MQLPLPPAIAPYFWPVVYGLILLAVFPLLAGYIVLLERKVMADIQARLGPMRVGPHGLLQPIADAVKLLLKEDIIPEMTDKWVFWVAPIISVATALVALFLIPMSDMIPVPDLNIGLLFILSLTSVGILGIILGGWSSNSHYPLLGALRSPAQLVSYEVALGFAIVGGLMVAGTLSMQEIVRNQLEQGVWFVFYQPVAFVIYFIAALAETNRAPFDMPEAESEIVAGYHTEYSGFRFALYFLAEYSNIVIVCSIATTLFLGGWLRPFPNLAALNFLDYFPIVALVGLGGFCLLGAAREVRMIEKLGMAGLGGALVVAGLACLVPAVLGAIAGLFWFMLKVCLGIYTFIWIRFTFPRYRYDQLMRIGWTWLIPLAMANVIVTGIVMMLWQ